MRFDLSLFYTELSRLNLPHFGEGIVLPKQITSLMHVPSVIGLRAVILQHLIRKPAKSFPYLIHARNSGKIIFVMTVRPFLHYLQRVGQQKDCYN
jgi:hypothetical protein